MKLSLLALLVFAPLLASIAPAQAEVSPREIAARIRDGAEKGDGESQFDLGIMYLLGDGVPEDPVEAAKWMRKAAEQGINAAQSLLGNLYAYGEGVKKDYGEAVKWYVKSADQGFAEAENALGRMYTKGLGVKQNYKEALKWYRKAADQNLAEGQFALGEIYTHGRGVAEDPSEALKWYRKAAEQGHSGAQFGVGAKYAVGKGVPKSHSEALKWYRKAADQGEHRGQYFVGLYYLNGEAVPKDEIEAYKWFLLASAQGLGDAKKAVDILEKDLSQADRSEGQRRAREFEPKRFDRSTAQSRAPGASSSPPASQPDERNIVRPSHPNSSDSLAALKARAKNGDMESQYFLGTLFANGGTAKDYAEASKWYRKAAEQGHPAAQAAIGSAYSLGKGVPIDHVEAAKWVRKAATQGFKNAQFTLGGLYYKGEGVPEDKVEAYKWFLLASEQGSEEARRGAKLVEGILPASQLADGRRRASEFTRDTAVRLEAKPLPKETPQSPGPDFIPSLSGTGFFITEDGYFVSNEHVAEPGSRIWITTTHGGMSATVIKVDKTTDLALLKAKGKFSALPITPSRTVRLGATAATVGFPNIQLQGFSPKLAKGEVASLSGAQDDARYFQISVPLQPGNSGGALVDERGNVIGVVSGKLGEEAALASSGTLAQNVNYAVKSSYLLSFLESVPEVVEKLKSANDRERKFEDVVKDAEQATVLVLVN